MHFKDFKITLYILASIATAVGIMYLLMVAFYSQHFFKGTIINGYDVSTMTVNEANNLLVDNEEDPVFTIVNDELSETIKGSELNLKVSFLSDLKAVASRQNPFLWYFSSYIPSEYTVNSLVVSDKGAISTELSKLDILNVSNNNKNAVIRIVMGKNGYELEDETVDSVDFNKLADKLSKVIADGNNKVDCTGCYIDKVYTEEQKHVLEEFDILDKAQNCTISFVDDDIKCTAGKPVVSKWIAVDDNNYPSLDESGNIVLKDDLVSQYVSMMSKLFDSGSEEGINWVKHDGSTIKVKPCYTYDVFQVDKEAQVDQIKQIIKSGEPVEIRPVYLTEGDRSADSNPKTYVEVDMAEQKMYFYKDGVLTLESDCVTGLMTVKDRNTPACMAHIYFKQKDRTLRGEGYTSFVHYWMAFNKGVGLHDAPWRHGRFGGDIYKHDGSHGCVNLPSDIAAQLYDLVEKGTLVVTYY